MYFNKLVPAVVGFSDLGGRDSRLGCLGNPGVSPPPGSEVVMWVPDCKLWLPV